MWRGKPIGKEGRKACSIYRPAAVCLAQQEACGRDRRGDVAEAVAVAVTGEGGRLGGVNADK